MRTLEQILAEMDAVQATKPELAELNSTSNVAIFRHLKNMWALLVQLVEQSWEKLTTDMDTLLESRIVGSPSWYAEQIKAFQYGDAVTIINGKVGYAVIDPTKQIIKQVAVIEDAVSGRLLVKVVKEGGTELSAAEKTALQKYIAEIKYAGVLIDVVSLRADQLKLTATIKYDRQVMDNQGRSLADNTKYIVRDALMAYLAKLPFDSVVSWTAITDYMQSVPGVKDFVISASEIAPFGTNMWSAFSRETTSNAGHLTLDAGSTFTFV